MMILEIEVTFPAGRFHGEEGEWPPAPSRLFQALVAATHRGAHGLIHQETRDAALRWLEKLPAPKIVAGGAERSCGHLDNYVPNNDGKAAHVRTAKTLAAFAFPTPDETKGTDEEKDKDKNTDKPNAIAYRWEFGEADHDTARHADVTAAMASLVTHLGQTTDGVYARGRVLTGADATAAADPETESTPSGGRIVYLPRETPGGRWLSPAPGFLALCQRRYPRSVSSEPPDFTNSRQVDYAPDGETRNNEDAATPPMAIFDLLQTDGESFLRFDPRDLRCPAGMARGALLAWAKKDYVRRAFGADLLARLLAGHRGETDFAPSDRNGHFGIVPLPSLSHDAKADGDIRRVALIGWGATDALAKELFDEAARGLHGAQLTHEDGNPARGTLRLAIGPGPERWRAFWTKPARQWRSVTPIVLPGLLRAGRAAENLIARALTQAGCPAENIDSVAAFAGPLIPKTLRARQYRLNDYLNHTPRCHAEILFKHPVSGPLVLGRGRYAGLGLCLPGRDNGKTPSSANDSS